MPLSSGTRLGPYEILALIGAGGMGEVYRARDTRLDRQVAVKVLPAFAVAGLTAGVSPVVIDDRVARFEREAKAVAALSHPNVVAIFDTGVQDGRMFVVMELLSGQTLRDAIAELGLRKAVGVAVQIARGLAAAHDKGIVHRDLKPENVLLTNDGQVKLLDFGLARQFVHAPEDVTHTRTAGTDSGTVMGTVGYMAPEQVRGQAADARTDLFAFGAVLYEMASGRRAFKGESAADTMTAILTQEPPDISSSRHSVPPALDRIIRHCLEKNPGEGFQSAHDVAFALESLTGLSSEHAAGQARAVGSSGRRWVAPAVLAATAAIAAIIGIAFERSRRPEPSRLQFEALTWEPQWITNARFGPDGRTVFFSAAKSGSVPSLYVIPPGALAPQRVGEPGTHLLAVSAKGEIAAITGARLLHHRIFAGTLSRLTMEGAARPWMQDVAEADFAPDGSTLAVVRLANGLWQLEFPAGNVLYTALTGYVSDPRVSPDATRVAFADHQGADDSRGVLKVVDTQGQVTTLSEEYRGLEGVAWAPDGRSVLFMSAGSNDQSDLNIVPIDRATPRQVIASPGHAVMSDVSTDGRLLLSRGDLRYHLRALVPGETVERDFTAFDLSILPSLSLDGRHLAFEDLSRSAGADYQVALTDLAANKVVRLGPGTPLGLSPDGAWAAAHIPSTQRILFYPTGPGDPVPLDRGPIDVTAFPLEWFSDSTRVLYCGREASAPSRCYVQHLRSGPPMVVTPDEVIHAELAGDDRTLLIRRVNHTFQVLPIGGTPVDAKGFRPTDRLLTWTADNRGLVVADLGSLPARIDVVDPWSGLRTPLKELAPPDRSGVVRIEFMFWLSHGRGYAYSYQHEIDQLFVVTGWQPGAAANDWSALSRD